MKHETFQELLALRLYDELSTEEDHLLTRHLEACAACVAFADELEATLGVLISPAATRADDLPANWAQRLREATRSTPSERRRLRPLATFVAGLAAGLLVMAGLRTDVPDPVVTGGTVTIATNTGPGPGFAARSTPPPRTTSHWSLARLPAQLWR